jgi:hypothetical protein
VILEILANTRKILNKINALGLEVLSRGYTAALEDLRCVDGTGRQYNFMFGADGLNLATSNGSKLDSRWCIIVLIDDEARNLVLDKEVKVREGISDPGIVTDTSVGSLDGFRVLGRGNPADTMLVPIIAANGGLETELLVRLPPDA